ncbi:hypothetical protein GTU99_16825 [Streptomyces sp. PRKS01-65]|nr:hypothetical protein [Streptomyces harenosi]NEY33843.1 hypothetical protein [Streptomyces harenosi]
MLRLRLKVINCPRRALALTDTPRPHCPDCQGAGSIESFYGDYDTGEYAGSDFDFCDCWTAWAMPLLPLPRWTRRTPPGGYSDEPPF